MTIKDEGLPYSVSVRECASQKKFECVFSLYTDLQVVDGQQLSAFLFPGKSGTMSLTPKVEELGWYGGTRCKSRESTIDAFSDCGTTRPHSLDSTQDSKAALNELHGFANVVGRVKKQARQGAISEEERDRG